MRKFGQISGFCHRFPPECFSCCCASAALARVALLYFWVNLL